MSSERREIGRVRTAACVQVLLALAVVLIGVEPAAAAADAGKRAQGLSEMDRACLKCHGPEGSASKPASGAASTRAVDGEAFARSLHGPIGCEGCHEEVALPAHPGNVKRPESARQYAIAQSQSCRACHARVSKTYERSVHAALLRKGNVAAPVCGDCHSPHEVTPASVQDGPKNACLACHDDTVEQHGKWLPNAASHVRAVACSACHAPASLRRVDLRMQKVGQPSGDLDAAALFEARARAADADADGLDAKELRALLADLESRGLKVALKGRIELRSGLEAHEATAKAQAIRDCARCHDENAVPFQSVVVSILDADQQARSLRRPQGSPELGDHLGSAARLLRDRRHALQVARLRARDRPCDRHRRAGPAPGPAAPLRPPGESRWRKAMTRVYVHPLPVRLWHWVNAAGFLVLIVTGLEIRYGALAANSLKTAVDIHNAAGFVLIANYFLWLGYYIFSDRITVYHPDLSPASHFRNVFRQLAYYGYGIFKGHPNPHHVSAYRKFNALQAMSYQIIMMVVVPLQFYTGVVLWDLQRFAGTVDLLGGARVVNTIHVLLFIVLVIFVLVHVYLTTLGRTASEHVKAMVTGYEETEEEPGAS